MSASWSEPHLYETDRCRFGCRRVQRPRLRFAVAGAAFALLWLSTQGCGRWGDSGNSGGGISRADKFPLVLREVNLGVVPRAGRREIIARLANPTDWLLRWAVLRTSCPCLSVTAGKNELDPIDDVLARICFDAREQPAFSGNLAVEVTAVGSDGTEVFRFDVLAEIVPEDELAFCKDNEDP